MATAIEQFALRKLQVNPITTNSLDIILWKDPKKSGTLLALFSLYLILLNVGNYTIFSLNFLIISLGLIVGGIWTLAEYVKCLFTSKANQSPLMDNFSEVYVQVDAVVVGEFISIIINLSLVKLKPIFFFANIWYSIKMIILFILFSKFGQYISGINLILLSTWFLFSAPFIYLKFQTIIDPIVQQVYNKYQSITSLLYSKIPLNVRKTLKLE